MMISQESMRLLTLDGLPFFEFFQPRTLEEKTFFLFEAERFCWINEVTKEISACEIFKEIERKHRQYILEHNKLIYTGYDLPLGIFKTTKIARKVKFVWALNLKTERLI